MPVRVLQPWFSVGYSYGSGDGDSNLNGLHEFRTRLAQPKLLILQGVDALKQEKFDSALERFQKSAELTPELPTSYYYSGVVKERMNDPAQAKEAYEKALELKPDYAQVYTHLGLLLWKSGDQTRGLQEFQKAVMSDPDLAEAHYNLGLALANCSARKRGFAS